MSDIKNKIIELLGLLDEDESVKFVAELNEINMKKAREKLEKKKHEDNMILLDKILVICKYCYIERCSHPFYRSNYNLYFSVERYFSKNDDYVIDKVYNGLDREMLLGEFEKEHVVFDLYNSYVVDREGSKYCLSDSFVVEMVNKSYEHKIHLK